jgi:hypothetical protein
MRKRDRKQVLFLRRAEEGLCKTGKKRQTHSLPVSGVETGPEAGSDEESLEPYNVTNSALFGINEHLIQIVGRLDLIERRTVCLETQI